MSDKARKLFDALDLDHNGELTRAEVISALRSKGPTLAAQGFCRSGPSGTRTRRRRCSMRRIRTVTRC